MYQEPSSSWRLQQKLDSTPIGRIERRQARNLQSIERLSGRMDAAFHGIEIRPSAIGALPGQQFPHRLPGGVLIQIGPRPFDLSISEMDGGCPQAVDNLLFAS